MADEVKGKYGIEKEKNGYTIETYNITSTPQRETVPDQKNGVRKELRYDTRYDLRMTVRGDSAPSDNAFEFDNKSWIPDSIEEAGSYNGLLRFNITAHRYDNCDNETKVPGTGPVAPAGT